MDVANRLRTELKKTAQAIEWAEDFAQKCATLGKKPNLENLPNWITKDGSYMEYLNGLL